VRDLNVFRLVSQIVQFESWGDRPCGSDEDSPKEWVGTSKEGRCPMRVQDIIATPTNISVLDWSLEILGSGIGQFSIELILKVFILMTVMKVFFALVQALVMLFLRTIVAPFVFLTIPLSGFSVVSDWAKGMLSHALVFPVALAMILIAAFLAIVPNAPFYISEGLGQDGFQYAPEMLAHSIRSGSSFNFLGRIAAVVIIAQIPNVQKLIEQSMKIPQSQDFAAQAGQQLKYAANKIPIVGSIVNWLT